MRSSPYHVRYDSNGNQRVEQPPAGGRTTVTWDYENQPTEYQLPSGSRMTLAYNADNRRVEKETTSGLTQFIWDAALDAYHAELDGSDSLQAVYTNPPVPFGNLISQRRGTTSHWHHPDSLGSTWALTDASQSITDTYLVDAWGNPLSSTGTTVNPFRWVGSVGYYFDTETGLYYIRARVYQLTTARWTSVDPLFYMLARTGMIGFGSNEPIGYGDGEHLYAYVSSSPLLNTDPEGTEIYDHPTDVCSGYKRTSPCQRQSICWWRPPFALPYTEDSYPKLAHACCVAFIEKYGKYAECVAKCLVEYEDDCGVMNGCDDRQRCRSAAHVSCYARCTFVPVKAVPIACLPIADDVLNL